jgi:tetratricopeptide (TPR) repeat protein
MLVVLASVAAYWTSFQGALVYDDVTTITSNPTIRNLWPPWGPLSPPQDGSPVTGRPLVNLTLAWNYAISGADPWSYHALNLLIHVLAALTLLGIVRRTLLLDALRPRFERVALPLATAAALIWAVHPLQTESVTYISQRAESMMGLLFLLTLYCAIRSADSPRRLAWSAAAVAACLAGMATKEVMVGAPLIVLLYDRAFLAGSFAGAIRRRWRLYAALAASWALLALLVLTSGSRPGTGGFVEKVSPLQYASAQPGVLLGYLGQVFWPAPLVLDYGEFQAPGAAQIVPGAIVIGLLLAATAAAVIRNWRWGFLGAWFFVILAPTSGLVRLAQTRAEHRMYLPLAAAAVLAVLGAHALGERVLRRSRSAKQDPAHDEVPRSRLGWVLAAGTLAVVTAALGYVTYQRNTDYRSEVAIWSDTIAKRPNNAKAYYTRGCCLALAGRPREAVLDFDRAIAIWDDYAGAYLNRGTAYMDLGQYDRAVSDLGRAIDLSPDAALAFYNRGRALGFLGRPLEAIRDFDEAVKLRADYAGAYGNRGAAYMTLGQYDRAMSDLGRAIEGDPNFAMAYGNRGTLYLRKGQYELALRDLDKAVGLGVDYPTAYYNRGMACMRLGLSDRAADSFGGAIQRDANFMEAWFRRGAMRLNLGQYPQAVSDFDEAIRLDPGVEEAYTNRGAAYVRLGQRERAVGDFGKAIELDANSVEPLVDRGAVYLVLRRYEDAARDCGRAIQLQPDCADAYKNRSAAYYHLGDYDRAWADVKTARRLGAVPDPEVVRLLTTASGRTE